MENEWLKILKSKWVKIVVALFVIYLFGPVEFINSGERGLRFTMGALQETELDEGINFKLPVFQKIKTLTIRPQAVTVDIYVDQNAAITKDNQSVGATITLFYKNKPGNLVTLWRDIGQENMVNIITKTTLENYKKAIGQYTIFDIAFNQEKVRALVATMTVANLVAYPIEVTELKITNYDWSDTFEKQIDETMQRAQQVKQKEQELLITEQEAQKKVKEAEAEKTAMITRAEGKKEQERLLAEAKALEGEGIRKYNQSVAANMQQEIEFRKLEIEKLKASKWNGQYVPTNHYGPIPIETGQLQPGR